MAEYIVSGPSSREILKAAGMEVITRCIDCQYSHLNGTLCSMPDESDQGYWMVVNPSGYCSQAIPKP